MNEQQRAEELANRVLSDSMRDPDSDVSVLARQFQRANERLQAVEKERDELRSRVQGLLTLPNLFNRCGPWKDVSEALSKLEALQPRKDT